MQARVTARRWWSFAVLVAPIAAFFAPVLFAGRALYLHDTATYFFPHKVLIGRALKSGHLPEWNPFEYAGVPLLVDPNFNAFHPLSVLTALWPSPWGYGAFVAANALVASVGAWVLARELGLSLSGRTVAALCFVWSGTYVSLMEGGQSVAAASLPWLIVSMIAAARRPGRGTALGVAAASALMFVSGTPEVGACGFLLGGLAAVSVPGSDRRRAWPLMIVGVLAGIAVAFIQIWPTFLFFRESSRSGGWSFEAATDYSLHPLRLLNVAIPFFQGELSSRGMPYWSSLPGLQRPYIQELYAGVVPLLLASFGLGRLRERTWRWMALGTLALTVVALGSYTPIYGALWRILPALHSVRFPEKFVVPLALILALFAGAGWDRLALVEEWKPWPHRIAWHWLAVWSISLVLLPWVVLWGVGRLDPSGGATSFEDTFPFLTSLAIELTLLTASVVLLAIAGTIPLRSRTVLGTLAVLAVVDLCRPAVRLDYTTPAAELMARPEVADQLLRLTGPQEAGLWRFDSDHHTSTREVDSSDADRPRPEKLLALRTEALSGAMPALDGLAQARGYSGFTLQPMKTLFQEARGSSAMDLLGVRFGVELGREGRSIYEDLGFKLLSTEAKGLIRVWQNPHAAPRLRLIDGILADAHGGVVPDCGDRPAVWLSPADQRQLPVDLPVSANCERLTPTRILSGAITVVVDDPETVQADVRSNAPALLLLNDAWDPGWSAFVDDAPVASLAPDGALRAVAVPAGHHLVLWRYRTPGLQAGSVVSVAGLLICLAVGLRGRRWRPARRGPARAMIPRA